MRSVWNGPLASSIVRPARHFQVRCGIQAASVDRGRGSRSALDRVAHASRGRGPDRERRRSAAWRHTKAAVVRPCPHTEGHGRPRLFGAVAPYDGTRPMSLAPRACIGTFIGMRWACGHVPLESSRRGGRFEYRHVHTRATAMPSAMAEIEPSVRAEGPTLPSHHAAPQYCYGPYSYGPI